MTQHLGFYVYDQHRMEIAWRCSSFTLCIRQQEWLYSLMLTFEYGSVVTGIFVLLLTSIVTFDGCG